MNNFFSGMNSRNWKKFAIKLARISATQGQIGMIFNLVSPKNPSLTRARFTEAVRLLKMGKAPKGFENNYDAEQLACDLAMGRVQIPPEQVKLLQGTSPKPKGKFYVIRGNSSSFEGGTVLTSKDGGIDRFRLASIKQGLKARKIGMFITRGATTAKMMEMLSEYTGVKYKRTDLDKAIADAQRLLDADLNLKTQRDLAKGLTDNRGLRRNAGSKTNCDIITSTDWEDKENTLVYEKSLSPVCVGQKLRSEEGYIVSGGRAPHKPSSSGRVYVKTIGNKDPRDNMSREFFPTVFNMKWIPSYNLYPMDKVSGKARLKINRNSAKDKWETSLSVKNQLRGILVDCGMERDSSPLKKLVMDLALDFSPVVKDIESSPYPTTQNNYGRYMSLISSMSKGDKKRAEIIAMALITAGANRSGVKSALRVMFGE